MLSGPGEDFEGIGCHPTDFVQVSFGAGVLEAFDHEGVETGADPGFPLGGQVDVAVQLAGVGIVDVERPEEFELGSRMAREDVSLDRGDVVADCLAKKVGVDVTIRGRVVVRR